MLIANLKENFNYSCVVTEDITEGTQLLGDRFSEPYHFVTDYGGTAIKCTLFDVVLSQLVSETVAPEQPKSPVIHTKDNVVIIKLFQTSARFGPIQ